MQYFAVYNIWSIFKSTGGKGQTKNCLSVFLSSSSLLPPPPSLPSLQKNALKTALKGVVLLDSLWDHEICDLLFHSGYILWLLWSALEYFGII